MAKPARVMEQPLEGVVHLGNDGEYHLGETDWLCHHLLSFFFAGCAVTTLLSCQLLPLLFANTISAAAYVFASSWPLLLHQSLWSIPLTCSHIPAGAFEVVIAVILGICIMVVLVFIGYFFLKKRKKSSRRRQPPTATNSTLSTTEDTEHLFYSSATKPV